MAGVYVGLSRETGLVKLGEKVGIMSLCVFTDDTAIERDPWFKIGEGLRVGRLEDGRVSPSLFGIKLLHSLKRVPGLFLEDGCFAGKEKESSFSLCSLFCSVLGRSLN